MPQDLGALSGADGVAERADPNDLGLDDVSGLEEERRGSGCSDASGCSCGDDVCLAFPVLSAREDGHDVFFVPDASGGHSAEAHQLAVQRMVQAGAVMEMLRRRRSTSRSTGPSASRTAASTPGHGPGADHLALWVAFLPTQVAIG
jgi:hypothetical protein